MSSPERQEFSPTTSTTASARRAWTSITSLWAAHVITCASGSASRTPSAMVTASSATPSGDQQPIMPERSSIMGPTTAMRLMSFESGSRPPSFFSSTQQRAASRRASGAVLGAELHLRGALGVRVGALEQAGPQLGPQDAAHGLVEPLRAHLAALDQVLQVLGVAVRPHVHVHAGIEGQGRRLAAVGRHAVGDELLHGEGVADHQAVPRHSSRSTPLSR